MLQMRNHYGISFVLLVLLLTMKAPAQTNSIIIPRRAIQTSWVGKPAPNFTLRTMQGQTVSLGDLRGKVVVLDFWASWCGPCLRELPTLEKLHREASRKGLVILGVNAEDPADARAFVQAQRYTFSTLLDEGRQVARLYQVTAIPTVIVIGRDGIVAEHFVGLRPEEALRSAIQKAQTGAASTAQPAPPEPRVITRPNSADFGNQLTSTIVYPTAPAPAPAGPTVKLTASPHPSALNVVLPTYPAAALTAKYSGAVQVRLLTNAQGRVTAAQALSGDPLLRQASLDAVKQWVFKPTLTMGKPTPTEYWMTFVFILPE